MKVLMVVRSNIYSSPGGDTTQVEMTAEYLRKIGVEVDIVLADTTHHYLNYDLLHFFNIIRPDDILLHIKTNIPFVISTIFVDYAEYEKKKRKGISGLVFKCINSGKIEYIKALARWIKNGDPIKSKYYLFHGHNNSIRKIVSKAKILLPNSNSEYLRLSMAFKLKHLYKKVVNAIDSSLFDTNTNPDNLFKDHVLCVGRIEGRKNQLNLIKAVIGTELQLTIIGKPSPNHLSYYKECKSLADSVTNVHFIDHIEHNKLVSIYKAAKVHALVSWFETTGLTSLEAGVMCCNLVITKKGDTEEYFKDFAYYCEPDDVSSIQEAVLKAYKNPVTPMLREHILANYTWEITARQTLEAYKEALSN